MILAIDIGNTNIVIGGFCDDTLSFMARIATNPSKTEDEYATKLKSVLALHGIECAMLDGGIISSVVPPLTAIMKKAVDKACGIDCMAVAPGIRTGINLQCDSPATVGSDLICGCVAAHHIYGSPALIIDMGTATKILLIDKGGSFCGCSIIPGVNISLKALAQGTAQLPQIGLEAPKSVIGKNTVDCMRSGVVFGHASMLDGMIDRYAEELGYMPRVYATGGLAPAIIPHCKHEIIYDDHLVLKGLNIIYNKNK